ncbi:butyrate kinase [Myxococcota bacterium]|nr:butyrate kinase [Myxococcota bacterium]
MYDIDAALDRQILRHMKDRPTVILTEADDPRTIEAAAHLPRFARLVFLAPEAKVREVAAAHLPDLDQNRLSYLLSEACFIDIEAEEALRETLAQACVRHHRALGIDADIETARRAIRRPSRFGIMAVKEGYGDMVVGGMRHDPKDFFRPMIRMFRNQPVLSEVGFFVLPNDHNVYPNNVVVLGDVGINADMDADTLAQVAVGTCVVARDLLPDRLFPRVRGSIVSYSHKGSDEGPSPDMVRAATALVPKHLQKRVDERGAYYNSIEIQGEVKVSVALSNRSARYYQGGEAWAGKSNVIIAPNLELGNFLFHLYASRYPSAQKFTVIFGIRFRGVDLPMDCSAEDARLCVKANILRLQRDGRWSRTPKDRFFSRHRILAINPGSTSTKVALYEGDQEAWVEEIQHSAEALLPYEDQPIVAQYDLRKEAILGMLRDHGTSAAEIDAFSGRGGLVHPIPHGTYTVSPRMEADLRDSPMGDHASNLGGLIARALAGPDKPAFIVDPVVVDEAPLRVKITGMKAIRRRILSHALNQIATGHRYAAERETFYHALNLIVCHMGGGITIGAHKRGRYIDVNDGLDGEGPFTPQRSGSIPTGQLIKLCFSGQLSLAELKQLNKGRGGLIDLIGTADFRELERRMDQGDDWAKSVFEAMTYQISKGITALIPAFDGERVDQILLTGGLARSTRLVEAVERFVAPMGCGLSVYPGENELYALAKGALRVLNHKEQAREYNPEMK